MGLFHNAYVSFGFTIVALFYQSILESDKTASIGNGSTMYLVRTELNQRENYASGNETEKCKYIKYNFHIFKLIDHLNLNVVKQDYNTGGKWLVHGTKHRKENQLQCLKHPLQVIPR